MIPPSTPVRALRIGGHALRFAAATRREEERLAAAAADEGRMLRRLLAAVREGDSFFDVGANIGTVTLPVAATGLAECLAFEPEPQNAARLAENADLNGFVNVTVIEAAVWSAPGRVGLRVAGPPGTGTHVVVEDAAQEGVIEVPAATIDELAGRGSRPPHVVKLDVEGAELEVLRGGGATLEAGAIRELFVETHPGGLEARGDSEPELVDFLGELGYDQVWEARRAAETHRHFRRRAAL